MGEALVLARAFVDDHFDVNDGTVFLGSDNGMSCLLLVDGLTSNSLRRSSLVMCLGITTNRRSIFSCSSGSRTLPSRRELEMIA